MCIVIKPMLRSEKSLFLGFVKIVVGRGVTGQHDSRKMARILFSALSLALVHAYILDLLSNSRFGKTFFIRSRILRFLIMMK